MRRIVLVLIILLIPATVFCEDYEEEAEIIETMLEGELTFIEGMAEAEDMDDIINTIEEFTIVLEETGPKYGKLLRESNELFQEPPDSMKETVEKLRKAQEDYDDAVNKSVRYANDHMDNEEFQKVFKRFNKAMYNMFK